MGSSEMWAAEPIADCVEYVRVDLASINKPDAFVSEILSLHDERDALMAEIARLAASLATARADALEEVRPLIEAAHGLSFGVDWNHGTHAEFHGYRRKLLEALPRARAALTDSPTADAEPMVSLSELAVMHMERDAACYEADDLRAEIARLAASLATARADALEDAAKLCGDLCAMSQRGAVETPNVRGIFTNHAHAYEAAAAEIRALIPKRGPTDTPTAPPIPHPATPEPQTPPSVAPSGATGHEHSFLYEWGSDSVKCDGCDMTLHPRPLPPHREF
jgi:hypothetical protein